jgi:hypothetical protein
VQANVQADVQANVQADELAYNNVDSDIIVVLIVSAASTMRLLMRKLSAG